MSDFSNFTRPIILSVEGNIGAGKTTIIEKMKERLSSDEIIFL
jgi:deoxyadenosine/deoxycytidine kinase